MPIPSEGCPAPATSPCPATLTWWRVPTPPAPLSAQDADVFLSFADAVVVAGVDPATLPGIGSRNADGSFALRNNNDLLQRDTVVGAAVQVGDPAAAADPAPSTPASIGRLIPLFPFAGCPAFA